MIGPVLWVVGALWATHALGSLLALRSVRPLPAEAETPRPQEDAGRVTAVVAARDEQDRIGETVRRLLGQRGVDLRVVAVDDRSADATGAVLDRAARADERLTVVRVDELPEGWLGKCHALREGAKAAPPDAEWLLFVDADVWLEPGVVARALRSAENSGAGHVTVIPGFARCDGLGKPAVLASLLPFFVRSMLGRLGVPAQQVGVGGFNLVRADAYRAFGGHDALRMEIVDDLYLAVLMNRAGQRSRIHRGFDDVEVEYAVTLRGLLRVTQKNAFAVLRFNTALATALLIGFLALWTLAVAGPLVERPAGWAALAGLVLTIAPAAAVCRTLRWNPAWALLTPVAQLVMPALLVHSMWSTLRAGGVRWRDTFYPLATLRRGRVR